MAPKLKKLSTVQGMNSIGHDIRIQFTLQYGNNREVIIMEKSDQPQAVESLRERARQLVEKYTPDSIVDDLHLFRHDYNSPIVLQHIARIDQLDNGCVVEVIVVNKSNVAGKPHITEVNNYIRPTFCDYCGEMLTGLIKQGVKCKECQCNFHKRCAQDVRNVCSPAPSTNDISPQPPTGSTESPMDASPSNLPHTLSLQNYRIPTVCKVCNNMLMGLFHQGLRCRDCKVNVHQKCREFLPNNCTLPDNAIRNMSLGESFSPSVDSSISMETDSPSSSYIPLFRLPGQASTRAKSQPKVDGWMIHFLKTDPERRLRHYWLLANNAINMYHEYREGVNTSRCYLVIPLAEIISITPYQGPPVLSKNPPHVFEIRTKEDVVYCVGENLHAQSGGPPTKMSRVNSIRPPSNTQLWFQALKEALQPPPSKYDSANTEPALAFADLYQVLSERTLGSGQFGTVYMAIQRHTGNEVAVKVISKERFKKGAEPLRAEVAILQRTSHSGIVRLEFMCETKDKIFVVMEKMNGDMLEMILTQVNGRLDERVTRFLVVQILSALKYLHDQGIAHCDLKPENVLLSDMATNFPQTKICDFGYARFIPESQFRNTIVGTPAYLPPEVLQRKGYNRSIDMWSVGVVIYVTLSGTFPFNEGEEVATQIQNAEFMFPTDPWSEVSTSAVQLIQGLLKVDIEDRLTIEKCLAHEWLKGRELYRDLRSLEIRLNCPRYLTSVEDDARYAEYLQQQGLAPDLLSD